LSQPHSSPLTPLRQVQRRVVYLASPTGLCDACVKTSPTGLHSRLYTEPEKREEDSWTMATGNGELEAFVLILLFVFARAVGLPMSLLWIWQRSRAI
jgi:hypothetical protein